MTKSISIFLTLLSSLFFLASACNDKTNSTSEATANLAPALAPFSPDTMPANTVPANVDFRDLNSYVSGDYYCIVGVVDNKSSSWEQIWIQVEVLDSSDNVLLVQGDSSFILRTYSDAIPPNGSTSFFRSIPLSNIAGKPIIFRVQGAGAVFCKPGPILVAPQTGGVRVQQPHPDDPEKIQELAFNLIVTVENPLPMVAEHPCMVLLLYGKDKKLYFAQLLDPEKKPSAIVMTKEGPWEGGEKREIRYPIAYEFLPQPLKDVLIDHIDVQVFEKQSN